MNCERCGADNVENARFCAQCGRELAAARGPADSPGADLDRVQADLESELGALARELDADLRLPGPAEKPAAGPPRPLAATGAKALIHQEEINALVLPPPGEVEQARGLVFGCRFVADNPQYKERVGRVTFLFADGDSVVNAYATDRPVRVGRGRTVQPPAVLYLGGLAHACSLGAAALAAHAAARRNADATEGDSPLVPTFQRIGEAVVGSGGKLDVEQSVEIFRCAVAPAAQGLVERGEERFVSLAQSYRVSMCMSVIAHELGHIALGHTLGREANYDISRNQEREADSFSASCLSTCPYREYHFLGTVFQEIVFAWVGHAGGARTAGTHPLSRERFENAFRNNSEAAREAAEQFGLTRDILSRLLPPS